MKRSLALTMIVKNEILNLPTLFESISGCFDKIYVTDTGSTDGTILWLETEAENVAKCPVEVFHFNWIDDFAEARNYNLPFIKEDYWMWLDADDALDNKPGFLEWKRSVMCLHDFSSAPYDYGFDENGRLACSFARERVFETKSGYKFQDFIHEGVVPKKDSKFFVTPLWRVKHRRTEKEAKDDISRNMSILEARRKDLSPRLQFYLGKEYFDNERLEEAEEILKRVVNYKEAELDLGDRTLANQYLCHTLLRLGKFNDAIKYTLASLYLDPNRAEFYCFLGDAYASMQNFHGAIPYYEAARACRMSAPGFSKIFTAPVCYFDHPTMRLAQIYYTLGDLDHAEKELLKLGEHKEAHKMLAEVKEKQRVMNISEAIPNDDIVITCMPGPYRWDEEIYKTKGLGGSETAAVEMAKHLARLTDRKVIIFNDRDDVKHFPHGALGVEYRPTRMAGDYFMKWKPSVHIAWRHNLKITNAKTYLWCHDLVTPHAENYGVYDKIICLSDFHKSYVRSCQAIPENKIWVSRNGLEPERFFKEMPKRQYGKVIWPNSLDRGLENALEIMDLVVKEIPSATFDIYYGIENLHKYGLSEKAHALEKMIAARPWVKYHGNVDQDTLARAFSSSDVWLYPATFIETFAITAIESLACRTWPVARKIGALQNTLFEASKNGMCDLVDVNPETIEGKKEYARLVIEAIIEQKHTRVKVDPKKFSWEGVAREWINEMKL